MIIKTMQYHSYKKQSAAILIISMIMLAVVSGLGLSAMSMAMNDKKSSAHFNQYAQAKSNAQSILPFAISILDTLPAYPYPTISASSLIKPLGFIPTNIVDSSQSITWWKNNGYPLTTGSSALPNPPTFIIEAQNKDSKHILPLRIIAHATDDTNTVQATAEIMYYAKDLELDMQFATHSLVSISSQLGRAPSAPIVGWNLDPPIIVNTPVCVKNPPLPPYLGTIHMPHRVQVSFFNVKSQDTIRFDLTPVNFQLQLYNLCAIYFGALDGMLGSLEWNRNTYYTNNTFPNVAVEMDWDAVWNMTPVEPLTYIGTPGGPEAKFISGTQANPWQTSWTAP